MPDIQLTEAVEAVSGASSAATAELGSQCRVGAACLGNTAVGYAQGLC
jgi:hypothetical protein